jgi:hypothetical protein
MKIFYFIILAFFSTYSDSIFSSAKDIYKHNNIQYQSIVGICPSKSSDLMLLMVVKEFEKNLSLKDVKDRIILEKLDEKYFISNYKINYNPVSKIVRISLECPMPLAKVNIYKSNGEEHYSAVLAENSKLYEPQYEILMRSEKKISSNLPLIALTTDQLETNSVGILTDFIKQVKNETRKKISEIIIDKKFNLTVVFSLGGARATSVFMGTDFWDVKITKLEKLLDYVSKNKRFPTTVNLVNAKKVVVKFSDNL